MGRRELLPPDAVDDVFDLFPDVCLGCAAELPRVIDDEPCRYQQLDLRDHRPHLTEFRRHALVCPQCGARTRAAYDASKIPASAFGPREQLLMYAARPAFSEVQLAPGQNQVRYYGVFAPTHGLRAQVVPKPVEMVVVDADEDEDEDEAEGGGHRYRVAWAKLLAKVFEVDAERCPDCGGRLRPVGAVTRREEARAALAAGLPVLGARGPPTAA